MRFVITASRNPAAPRELPEGPFDEALFSAYMKFNEEMQRAGVLVASEGLNPAKRGAQVVVRGGKRELVDGPYAESKELVGGFYVIEVPSLEEAISWALKCPSGMGSDDVLTIHPMTGPEDIPPNLLALIEKVAPTWSAAAFKPRAR